MSVLSRAEAAELVCRLFTTFAAPQHAALDEKEQGGVGLVEFRILLDAIYGGPPAGPDEEITRERIRALDQPFEEAQRERFAERNREVMALMQAQAHLEAEARLRRFEANSPPTVFLSSDDMEAVVRAVKGDG